MLKTDDDIITIAPQSGGGGIITLDTNLYTLDKNYITYADQASLIQVTVTIVQSANQTITVTCNGQAHTSTFTANYFDTITVKVVANSGYEAGTPNITSATLTGDITIYATAATNGNVVIEIGYTHQSYFYYGYNVSIGIGKLIKNNTGRTITGIYFKKEIAVLFYLTDSSGNNGYTIYNGEKQYGTTSFNLDFYHLFTNNVGKQIALWVYF